jgi:hypothetical protein
MRMKIYDLRFIIVSYWLWSLGGEHIVVLLHSHERRHDGSAKQGYMIFQMKIRGPDIRQRMKINSLAKVSQFVNKSQYPALLCYPLYKI